MNVGNHLGSKTVNKFQRVVVDDKMNEMVLNVNVLHSCMETFVFDKCDGGLAVRVQCHGKLKWSKYLCNESAQLDAFFGGVHCCSIFGFSG